MADTDKIIPALVAFQAEMPVLTKDAKNPHFNRLFASLPAIVETIQPLLAKHRLGFRCYGTGEADTRGILFVGELFHESGQSLESRMVVPMDKPTAQDAGKAMTYARRYLLCGLLNLVADEDDDAESLVRKPAPRQERPPEPAPSPRPAAGVGPESPISDATWRSLVDAAVRAGLPRDKFAELVRATVGRSTSALLEGDAVPILEALAGKKGTT